MEKDPVSGSLSADHPDLSDEMSGTLSEGVSEGVSEDKNTAHFWRV